MIGTVTNTLQFPHKMIRSKVIAQYMKEAGYKKAVCFTCGNAGRELRRAGVETIIVGGEGDMLPNRWLTTAEIHRMFPDCFDATSGHLNADVMNRIASAYREYLGELPAEVEVPSGSGECLVCLKLAYPQVHFIAEYDVVGLEGPTQYCPRAPLVPLVGLLAEEVRHGEQLHGGEQ